MDAAFASSSRDTDVGQLYDDPKRKITDVLSGLLRGRGRGGLTTLGAGTMLPTGVREQIIDMLLPKKGGDAEAVGEVVGDPLGGAAAKLPKAALVGIMVGPKAMERINPMRLAETLGLQRAGAGMQEMWNRVGAWVPFNEGMRADRKNRRPLFHIDSEGAKVVLPNLPAGGSVTGKMEDMLLNADKVYDAAPNLRNVKVGHFNDPADNRLGTTSGDGQTMTINSAYANKYPPGDVVMHEGTHTAQIAEDLASGGNTTRFMLNAAYGAGLPQILHDLLTARLAGPALSKFSKGAHSSGMVNVDQLNQVYRQMMGGRGPELSAQQMMLALKLSPEELGKRITQAKFMQDLRPPLDPAAYHHVDEGEAAARLAGSLFGKPKDWVRQQSLAKLLHDVGVTDLTRVVDVNKYDRDVLDDMFYKP